MATWVEFGGYRFSFQVLTTGNVYDVDNLRARKREAGAIVLETDDLSYGEGAGRASGVFSVRFDERAQTISWQAEAEHVEPIKGIKVFIEPFDLGTLVRAPGVREELGEGLGRCYAYPCGYHAMRERGGETGILHATGPLPGMGAQFVLIEHEGGITCIRSNGAPPRFKRFWFYRVDDHIEVHLYSEENGCDRSTRYFAPEWSIDRVASWQEVVEPYAAWMEQAFGLTRFEDRADVPSWLKEIALVAILHGVSSDGKVGHDFAQMGARLIELADRFPPHHTLVKLLGFEGRVDYHLPDNLPAEGLGGHAGFQRFMNLAHELGFRVLLHLNHWGVALDHPRLEEMREHQIIDLSRWPAQWDVDYDKDEVLEPTFAYISPDASEFRALMVEAVGRLVQLYHPDAIHLDQSAFPINDLKHNHMRGVVALFAELKAAFPRVLFTGEGTADWIAAAYPLSSGTGYMGRGLVGLDEMFVRLIGRYVRCYAHSGSMPPEPYRGVWTRPHPRLWWSEQKFRALEESYERLGVIPTLVLADRRVRIDCELAGLVFERARRWLARL